MTDRMVIRLSENWAILADTRQWIAAKARKRGTGRDWKPVAYVASKNRILRRVLRENGAVIDAGGQRALDALPDSFPEWLALQNQREAA